MPIPNVVGLSLLFLCLPEAVKVAVRVNGFNRLSLTDGKGRLGLRAGFEHLTLVACVCLK